MTRQHVGILAVAFGVPILVVLACGNLRYPTTAYRCKPASDDPTGRCPGYEGYYQCCSDDPAALDLADLEAFVLPRFIPENDGGTPLFAAQRNDASEWGMCIEVGTVPPNYALADEGAQGCPIPCNPTWDVESIEAVCGVGTLCCQTSEVEADDCVFDPELGDEGCFRPVRGGDIEGFGGLEVTDWSGHATHQDPRGLGCETFVESLTAADLDAAGVSGDEVMRACLRRLGSANQRGFCIGGTGVIGCPLAQPSYRDACEQLNDANGLGACG